MASSFEKFEEQAYYGLIMAMALKDKLNWETESLMTEVRDHLGIEMPVHFQCLKNLKVDKEYQDIKSGKVSAAKKLRVEAPAAPAQAPAPPVPVPAPAPTPMAAPHADAGPLPKTKGRLRQSRGGADDGGADSEYTTPVPPPSRTESQKRRPKSHVVPELPAQPESLLHQRISYMSDDGLMLEGVIMSFDPQAGHYWVTNLDGKQQALPLDQMDGSAYTLLGPVEPTASTRSNKRRRSASQASALPGGQVGLQVVPHGPYEAWELNEKLSYAPPSECCDMLEALLAREEQIRSELLLIGDVDDDLAGDRWHELHNRDKELAVELRAFATQAVC